MKRRAFIFLGRRAVIPALVVGSIAGGVIGATAINAASSTAATTTTTSTPAPPGAANGMVPHGMPQNGGRFVPNENPAHEKTESAQREAQENAGQVPTVP